MRAEARGSYSLSLLPRGRSSAADWRKGASGAGAAGPTGCNPGYKVSATEKADEPSAASRQVQAVVIDRALHDELTAGPTRPTERLIKGQRAPATCPLPKPRCSP